MAAASGWSNLRLETDPPSASPSPRAGDSGQAERPLHRGAYILLVEDSPTDVFVIKEVLRTSERNIPVTVAKDGQEALRYLEDPPSGSCPALVLLDLNIPKINGLDVLRRLRNSSPCYRTPVIIVSSSRAEEDRIAAEQLGADAYFQKPGNLESYTELARVVDGVLSRTPSNR